MDVPDWIDGDIIYSFGYWAITGGTIIAFLLGFKLAEGGLFGVATGAETYAIPLIVQISLILLTPILAYLVAMKIFR